MRLSVKRDAGTSSTPQNSTGNSGERSGEISVLMLFLGNVFGQSEAEWRDLRLLFYRDIQPFALCCEGWDIAAFVTSR
jgi:hypothetical protein